ncbi:hypothetical protein J6590_040646 [Homalodisca vitripennis]|nr:hypothetical protein J6590_040646 [Homalodisca vitripennis]
MKSSLTLNLEINGLEITVKLLSMAVLADCSQGKDRSAHNTDNSLAIIVMDFIDLIEVLQTNDTT